MVLFDGLFAKGPVMHRCRELNWQSMILPKDKDLTVTRRSFTHTNQYSTKIDSSAPVSKRRQHISSFSKIEHEFIWEGSKSLDHPYDGLLRDL